MQRPRSRLAASAVRSDGSFTLAPALLQTLAPPHPLHLEATDKAGKTSSLDLSFVLDTKIAPPSFDLGPASDSGKKGDHATTVILVTQGSTDPNAQVTPLGAERTASGYEVARKVTDADQYSVWATDSSGSHTSSRAETGDQLVVNGAVSDTIDASSLPLGTITLAVDGGLGDDVLFGGQESELLLGAAGNDVLPGGVASTSSIPAIGDEFVGPFPSWTNVKIVYGAKGDGITDDTAALQAALTNVGLNGHSSVVYLPAGTYKITSTLNLAAREHISIIGEDPATTIIKWAGASEGTELHIDGVDYSRFDRLTFDGAGVAGVLVDQSWSGGNYFDSGNQYADDVFKNAAIGIQGGAQGGGFSETSVRRDHFSNLTTAGILTRNYNALNLWVSYSTFDHCYVGVGNAVFFPDGTTMINGAGAFEVSNSVFRYSGQADISIGNVASPYAVRNNYSIGSKQFIITAGTATSAPLTISGNTILDTTNSRSLVLGNFGPNVLYDNTIRSLPLASGPVVEGLNVVALGNTFTVPNAIQNQDWAGNPLAESSRRIAEIDTTVVSASTISTTEPTLPGVEPNLHRQIFEVPVGADAATIQRVINSAAAQNGNRPIVHIPEGNYLITSTITIPANTDIQLVGDGNTKLTWTGTGSGPLLYLPGPTKATLRDLQLDGGYRPYDPHFAAGIVADNIDQPGSVVYLDKVLTAFGLQTNFLADGLDYTDIEAHDFSHLYQQNLPGSVGVRIVGGPLAAAGAPQTGSVNIYSGLSSNEMLPWYVSGGGKLLVRDVWYEGSPSPAYLLVTGAATVTMEGLMVAYSLINQSTPTFDINNFKGNATFINNYTTGTWAVSGDGTQARVLGVGLNEATPTTTYFSNNASPAATVGLLQSMNQTTLGIAEPTPNTGTLDDTFVKEMFAHTRGEEPRMLTALPAGVTDLRLFRVYVSNSGTNNLVFSAGSDGDLPPITVPLNFQAISSGGPTETLAVPVGNTGVNIVFDGLIFANGTPDFGGPTTDSEGELSPFNLGTSSTDDDLNPDNLGFRVRNNEGWFAVAQNASGRVHLFGLEFDIQAIGNVKSVDVNYITFDRNGATSTVDSFAKQTVSLPSGSNGTHFAINDADGFDAAYLRFTFPGQGTNVGVRLLDFSTTVAGTFFDQNLQFGVKVADGDQDTATDTFTVGLDGNHDGRITIV
jgi:Pectate lyase superfamily protein